MGPLFESLDIGPGTKGMFHWALPYKRTTESQILDESLSRSPKTIVHARSLVIDLAKSGPSSSMPIACPSPITVEKHHGNAGQTST